MNDNENKDLFDVFGIEHAEENNQVINDNNINKIDDVKTQSEEKPIVNNFSGEATINNDINKVDDVKTQSEEKAIGEDFSNETAINNNSINLDEEELLKLYIGPNYDGIVNESYSYCSLLFGLYYFFYRKQYNYAYLLLLVQIGVVLCYDFLLKGLWYLLMFAYLIICFVIGASFKKNYIIKAKEKITEINNQNISLDEKKTIIQKTGGVDNRAYILLIVFFILSFLSSILTLKFLTPGIDIEFHFPEEFKQNTTTNLTEYKVDKYDYYDFVVNHRTSDNVCNYKVVANNEYLGTDKEKMITKYLKDKYSLENIKLEEKKYGSNEYFYYYDQKEKKDYYIHFSDRYFSEISATYIKDQNKKCHKYTEYILNNIKKVN